MNEYGALAQQHWRRWRPDRLSAIPDDQDENEFFAEFGRRIAALIADRTAHLAMAESATLSDDHETRTGQLAMIRHDAEQTVLLEEIFQVEEAVDIPDRP